MNHGQVFINGQWQDYKEAALHISDLVIHRGYGIFDYLRERDGSLKYLDAHVDRFFHSKDLSKLTFDYSKDELKSILHDMIAKNGFGQSGIKFILTGGYSDNGFAPSGKSNFIIINYDGKITYKEGGCNLVMDRHLRPNPEVKSIQYFNSALLYDKMQRYEAVDVLYHHHGEVSECSRCNFYIVKNGEVITSPNDILQGITRKRLLAHCESTNPIQLRPIRTEEIYTCDEMFITSSTKDILPIVKIEDHTVGNGKVGVITQKLMDDFNDL